MPTGGPVRRQVWLASHGSARCHLHAVAHTIDGPWTTERDATLPSSFKGGGEESGFGAEGAAVEPAARWSMS